MKHPAARSGTPPPLTHLVDALGGLAKADLLRERPPHPVGGVSFCSNDYLGLASRVVGGVSAGAGASRLVAGEHPEHRALEGRLAGWLGVEACLLFTSGYAANVGVVSALADAPEDLILSDALNHASIVDGCRLSRAEVIVYPHLDLSAVEGHLRRRRRRRAWVITESYFSMDADSPDLPALRRLCDEHGAALIVDEAHALGVLGPGGRGLLAASQVQAEVTIGTLGKAFGGGGAFVGGCPALIAWLWNRARTFVFSTGLSPVLARAGREALEAVEGDPSLREQALERAGDLRGGLARLGHRVLGYGHIVPWVVGDARAAMTFATQLQREGLAVQAIRPPSVPAGTSRLRLTASASQSRPDVARLVEAIARLQP